MDHSLLLIGCYYCARNFDWQSSGNIKFEYLRYDRVAHGPSDLDNFQVSLLFQKLFLFDVFDTSPHGAIGVSESFSYNWSD